MVDDAEEIIMRDIPEVEARALLRAPLRCEDCGSWQPLKMSPDTMVLGAGILDVDGVGARMQLELSYRCGHKTKIKMYVFTVFKRNPYGSERVYQLAVTQSSKPIKDAHRKSHEHYGDARIIGQASWEHWDFDAVLAHFCMRTGIVFDPQPPHPEHFELTEG